MKIIHVVLISLIFCFCACSLWNSEDVDIEKENCPLEIRARALAFAELYAESETEYAWGGQDPLRAIQIDCSGLVVICYTYALVDTSYTLLFNDATSYDMLNYSQATESPQKGDLIFMGESDTEQISHIALFDCIDEDGNLWFIDSTKKQDADIDGVTKRSYPDGDLRFKSFGIMQVTKR